MRDGFIKVGAATPKVRVADPAYNREQLVKAAGEAAGRGVKLLAFPELSMTAYTCGDLFGQEILVRAAREELARFAAETEALDILMFVGLPWAQDGKLYNVAAAVKGGRVLGLVPKLNLPNFGEFYEARNFEPGCEDVIDADWEGEKIPMGSRLLFVCREMPALQVAAEICEDLWVPEPPSVRLALNGATLIVNLSASDEIIGKKEYRKNLMLLLPHDGVSFHKDRSAEYSGYVAEAVYEAINAAGGGALVLFTSKDMMNSVYSRLRGRIDDLMKQDDAALRSSLLSAFCSREDSSLLALSSFWEGIDAPGRTLRLVIIVKLPFSVPTAPIEAARSMNIEKKGGRVFFEMSLPEATLKLKQGLGRLIRSEEDRGVVLILDNRILSHGYGRVMISSLPECYIPEDASLGNIASKIERFLY